MEIRELVEKDYLDSLKLSMYAFQYKVAKEKIQGRLEKLKEHKILGIWEENNLAAKLHIIPFQIFLCGDIWTMGGIAGVATYPEFRRNGHVKNLITESLKRMREDHQIVSLLAPFDISFYRKFGWEILSEYKKITFEKAQLKFLAEQKGYIKRYTKDTHTHEIEDLYEKYSKRFSGMLVRKTNWWLSNVYDDDSKIAVYFDPSNNAKGYILYSVKERKMEIQEMVALDYEAKAGLWNFICQHDSMLESASITLPIHDSLSFLLSQPKVKTELFPYFMARIVDVEECLKKFSFNEINEPLFLHITDSFAHWNNGSYLITTGDVRVYKEKQGSSCSHPPKKGIQLSINALSAILFGYKRPIELYEMNLINGSIRDMEVFERLVPSLKSAFYDFF